MSINNSYLDLDRQQYRNTLKKTTTLAVEADACMHGFECLFDCSTAHRDEGKDWIGWTRFFYNHIKQVLAFVYVPALTQFSRVIRSK